MNGLYAEVWGEGNDLVLLHGWVVCSSDVWQDLIKSLVKKFRVTVIDLPGFGRSPLLNKNYDLQTIAEQILEVAPKKAIWLGWSLGGLIAMWIASNKPERVSHLITVACTPRFIEDKDWPGLPNKLLLHFRLMREIVYSYQKTFTHIEYRVLSIYCAKRLLRYGLLRFTVFKKSFNLMRTADLREHCLKITCPMLKILGDLDFLIPKTAVSAIQGVLPNAKIAIMEGCSHAPFLSQQALFLQIIDEFLEQN